MMLLRYRGLLVLALWQTPLPVHRDEAGRVRFTLGFGAGAFEHLVLNCAGDVVSAEKVPFRSVGAQVDAWPDENLRITGFGGRLYASGARNEGPDGFGWSGPYGGGVVAFEGGRLGLGGGMTWSPDAVGRQRSFYARFGRANRLYVRLDKNPPVTAFATTGAQRIGLGFGDGRERGVKLLAGVAGCHVCGASKNAAGFAEMSFPVGQTFDVEVRGLMGAGESTTPAAFGVAGRVHLGRRTRPQEAHR